MRENTDQNNSEYGHFLRSYALLVSEYHSMKSLEYWKWGLMKILSPKKIVFIWILFLIALCDDKDFYISFIVYYIRLWLNNINDVYSVLA